MERFGNLAVQALNRVLENPIQLNDLEIPPDPNLGDFAFPCFKLAKSLKKAPQQIAQQILESLNRSPSPSSSFTLSAVGPYVNFTVLPEQALKSLLSDILSGPQWGSYGSLPANTRETWVLEYSSPNVAKPLNIYHLRPTALGATLDRIGRFRGYRVISINHLGDWGKQYGLLTVAFKRFGKTVESQLRMKDLVEMYVKINAEAEKNPEIHQEAREAFLALEKGDQNVEAIWKKCVNISLDEFDRIYKRLGVHFDYIWGESFYKNQLGPLLEELRNQGLLVQSEGAEVVYVEDENGKEIPPCILRKSDGATIYATRDVAAAIYRYEKFHFDRMTYIVGAEQKLHFKQVFAVLRKMNLPWAKKCEHIPFGLYRFKDAKMSTRKGNFIVLEEVLEMTKERVADLMRERQRPVNEETTEAVALGAVVFHDLHTDPIRDVEFDLESVVDFEGETGPYLQYAHTRCLSIIRKAHENNELKGEIHYSEDLINHLKSKEEINLIKILGQFPIHLERSLDFGKASQLASYLIDVTRVFGAFYRECQVLGNSGELTKARLMLVEATRRILGRGLNLMGIPLPERM